MTKIFGLIALSISCACGGKVVFQDDDGAGASGAGGAPLCGGEVCGEGNQCCCDSCITLDLPCDSSCGEPPLVCAAPYHVLTADGSCVWSCGEGTQPDDATSECECEAGLVEIGADALGRRICAVE